jgi:hypothetical protein
MLLRLLLDRFDKSKDIFYIPSSLFDVAVLAPEITPERPNVAGNTDPRRSFWLEPPRKTSTLTRLAIIVIGRSLGQP